MCVNACTCVCVCKCMHTCISVCTWTFQNSLFPQGYLASAVCFITVRSYNSRDKLPGQQINVVREIQIINKCYKIFPTIWGVMPQQIRMSLVLKRNTIAPTLYTLIYECKPVTPINICREQNTRKVNVEHIKIQRKRT